MKKEATQEPLPASEDSKKKKGYVEIKLPRFSFQSTSMNVYLVYTLVIFAFLLGMLTNKVIYLEKAAKSTPSTANNAQAGEPTTPPPPQVVDVSSGKLPILGNKDAKVTMVEFSDFQCPFCKRYFDDAAKQVNEHYIKTGKVKFAYRHAPLNAIHPNAQKAGEASECANEQGKFWEYHDLLFKNQETWSPQSASDVTNSFVDYAGELSLQTDQFRSCLETGKYKEAVDKDNADAQTAKVDGTPTFFINGYRVVGAVPFTELQKVIEQELKK